MKGLIVTTLVAFLLVLSGCSSSSAGKASPPNSNSGADDTGSDAVADIQQELERLEEEGLSGVLRLRYEGEILMHEAYGWRDRRGNEPMTTDTGFDIGSITKPITDATVLKLEEQGELSTNDTLGEFFRSVPEDKRDITIQQLLEHRSGLPEYLGDDYELVNREEALERIFEEPLEFSPGSEEAYSNAGYSLLAMVIEEATGESYEQAVRQAVLEPADTAEIGYILPGWTEENLAVGYTTFWWFERRWGTPLDKSWLEDGPSWTLRGNGGMLATAQQLARWFDAVYTGDVLGPEALDAFYELNGGEAEGVGGIRVGQAGGNDVFNAIQESWVDQDIHLTLFTSTPAPENAESAWEEIQDEVDTLARISARSEP